MTWTNRIVGHDEVPPDQLLAHPDNWRIHPAYQQKALKGVIDDIGYIKSVTVNKLTGRVVDGHLRVTLALRDNVPTIPVEYVELTEAEEAEALLTLDPIAALAGADKNNLEALLQQVNTGDAAVMELLKDTADKAGLDWGNEEPKDAEPQIDRAAELLEKWQVKTGDLWQIGEHRLLCGDSTKREDVERVMGGERAGVSFTSPPYADQREYKNDGNLSPEHLSLFISSASGCVNIFCVNLGMKRENGEIIEYWQEYIKTAKDNGFKLLSWNIWDKGRGGSIGSVTAMFPIEHEFIFVFGKDKTEIIPTIPNQTAGEKKTARVMGVNGEYSAKQSYVSHDFGKLGTIYRGRQVDKNDLHPAMFPVEFAQSYIEVFSGDVYEPFNGSGTTLVACQNLGRRGRAIEISTAYCAVTLERMATAFPALEIKRINQASQ